MSTISEAVTRAWYQNKKWVLLFLPLSFLFGIVSAVRKMCYQWGWLKRVRVSAPVIIVGNISVGGTGKSPVTGYLAAELKRRGYKPGIVSRGYGGKSNHYPTIVEKGALAAEVGDEPIMLHQMTECPVAVDPVRSRAAEKLCVEYGCDLIICDDGLQHYALHRNVEICVIDGERGLGNGHLLPVGPLRESESRISSVDFVIVNGRSGPLSVFENMPHKHTVFEMSLKPVKLVNVYDDRELPIAYLKGREVHAVAGIGNPERFFLALKGLGANVNPHSFPDHHDFGCEDLQFDDNKDVIMTHKDAVKCKLLFRGNKPENVWYMPVAAELNNTFMDTLCNKLDTIDDG
ncbi:tetraacyldisaccharide 4'-kinase [Alkalimarinus coralli]|uniref:tetraacyldisaccharide 4'-kinase n=1 Tax=Alkalimarinus coralli TaxID=2935863 RepID=UPI00202B13F9|nr:tetraacyldisaccharide 4'-kinase [Alkalimarinus coralli]